MSTELIELVAIAIGGPVLLGIGLASRRSRLGRVILLSAPALCAAASGIEVMRWIALEGVGRAEFHALPNSQIRQYAIALTPSWKDELPRAGVILEYEIESARSFSATEIRKAKFRLNGRDLHADSPAEIHGNRIVFVESIPLTEPLLLEYEVTEETRPILQGCRIRVHPSGPLKGFWYGWKQRVWKHRIAAGIAALWFLIGLGLLASIFRVRTSGSAYSE